MSEERSADTRSAVLAPLPPASVRTHRCLVSQVAPTPTQRPNVSEGVSGSAYIITGVGLAFTAVVVVLIWVRFFRRRTLQRLMQEMEAARIARELEAAQQQAIDAANDDMYDQRPPSPKRPVVIKDAVVIEHPDGTTGFAYNTDDSDDDGSIDGDAALAKLHSAAFETDAPRTTTELSTVVVVSEARAGAHSDGSHASSPVVVARENTFEWVGTGPQLPRPPHLLEQEQPQPTPSRRRWYHRALGLRAEPEAPSASGARPVMTSTVLGAHDAAAHPMALAFSFGG